MPGKKKNSSSNISSGPNKIAELLRSSMRVASERKIGIEIERIGLWKDGTALHYSTQSRSSKDLRPGAEQLLNEIKNRYHWEGVENDHGQLLGFKSPFGKVSLEPGSQLELSTETHTDLYSLIEEVRRFEKEIDRITAPWGLHWVGLAVNPFHRPEMMDVIPSHRYHIMTDYLGQRGRLGTSMMRLTSSIQINLDYSSEAEGIEMLRTALAAAPLSYALFSNGPWNHGDKAGVLSYRNSIWRETDPDRTGLLPAAFDPTFDFDAYADLIWHEPLMFAQNQEGQYVPAQGKTLEQISNDELNGVVVDERNRLNAVREMFTEARLKPGYVEVRSVDGQSVQYRYAAVAFWVGILYHAPTRKFILDHLGKLSPQERNTLWIQSAREGLKATYDGKHDLKSLMTNILNLCREGLKSRNCKEERLLEPVEQIVKDGENPAEQLLRQWNGQWHRKWAPVIEHVSKLESP
jgi:glutamate--cysteine ligase